MSILIVTLPGDAHAHAVRWAVEQLGGTARILYPADLCNGARWSLDPASGILNIQYRSAQERHDFAKYRTIWMRRPPLTLPQEHIKDNVERAIAEDDFSTMARGVYLFAQHGRFAVNRLDETRGAEMKPYQLAVAASVGLDMPPTLIGNTPDAIMSFYDACGHDVVFKPFRSPIFPTKSGPKMIPTTRLTLDMLQQSDLSAAPGIFQMHIAKVAEVRVTIMGRSVFAWEKRFNGREDMDVDWRFMFRQAAHAVHKLPAFVEGKCFSLLDKLGLVFGCFDFIIDRDGCYYFLEVNPQGQWLWGDSLGLELNQLEAMAEFLMSGDPLFNYKPRGRVRAAAYSESDLAAACKVEESAHHEHLMTFRYHQAAFRVETAVGSQLGGCSSNGTSQLAP